MKYIENDKYTNLVLDNEVIEEIEFTECVFEKCKFLEVNLINCIFKNCKFKDCVICNIKFDICSMMNTLFVNNILVGIDWTLLKLKGNPTLPFTGLESCQIRYNIFHKMQLMKFDFSNCQFEESYFEECNLVGSSFYGLNLSNTIFTRCDLSKSDFREATEYNIDVKDNIVRKARFSFPEVVNLLNSFDIIID
jgi:fluoroquinolone resistance protein